jgi:glycosyltransferase involved in cell wall biosynthesis
MVQTSLIILTRNEISGLKSLISKIPFDQVDEYFLVDYKSTDGTVEFARKNHIPVITQIKPGRAEAFRVGAEISKGKYLIFFSPDGNEDPNDIGKLISLLNTGVDVAIASRFLTLSRNEEDGQIFKWRAWANEGLTYLANLFFNRSKYVTDTINGYRAITKKAFNKLNLDAEGFAIEYQISIRAMKLGLAISEIPTIEGPRIGGHSTSYAIPTGIKFVYYFAREIIISNRF